jgi:hypothetical protein
MVIYDLICERNHRFEGWFPSFEAYEEQTAQGQVACPTCRTVEVERVPHACAVHVKREGKKNKREGQNPEGEPSLPLNVADAKEILIRLHHFVRENFEDVGPRFAEEIRQISYGKAKKRPIHGTATKEERAELDDEGIPYISLPKPELDS